MANVKLTISLPQQLADFADQVAAESGRPRSHVIAEALREKRRATLRQELEEAYEATSEDNRKFAKESLHLAAEIWEPYEPAASSRRRRPK